jgi:murein DD-endopeptidase MepM/ murein hydrolase activator NlpD
MHQIDATFRQRKEEAAASRRRGQRRKWLAAGVGSVLALMGAGYFLTYDQWSFGIDEEIEPAEYADPAAAEEPVFVPAIVDLAGDPMIINIGRAPGDLPKTREVPRPEKLMFPGVSNEITVLSDTMLSSSERFMTTLPSTQEDFAFFQAQRSRPAAPEMMPEAAAPLPAEGPEAAPGEVAPGVIPEDAALAPETPGTLTPADQIEEPPAELDAADDAPLPGGIPDDVELAPVPVDEMDLAMPPDTPIAELPLQAELDDTGAGWGETVASGQEQLPDFKRTRVEDTTSITFLMPELERFQQTEDFFVKVKSSRSLDGLVLEQGFGADDAKLAGEALKATLDMETLDAGFVVALRGFRESAALPGFRLMQVSVYADQTYLGSIARADDGSFVSGADPWVDEDLFDYSGEEESAEPQRQYRLLDAIYSTAARNNVPTGVIGEAIMLLSRSQDLNAFTTHDDRLLLAFSHQARDGGSGRVLYAAVRGTQKKIECYVFRPQAGGDFTCMTEDNQSVTLTITNGMVTPVNGVMKSTFGPRKHPILGVVRIHKGVDWAAPMGTPVFAAFDGKVSYAGDGKDYGNLIKLSHPGSKETRYAHLSRFAEKSKPGTAVKAGDIIGYVGTTGLSTGPHLHFEIYSAGRAIDPLQSAVAAIGSDGSAVGKLVDRIIRVVSGGSATAKNPLSSATGLGQFISSTWLRMMRTYRPDLARSLSTADQLALRFDPTLSREMVTHLAQEGEAYLRARGHQITAGRLYLCHFLGMEGAHTVLSASPDAALIDVLGASVIKANPFLTGQSTAHVMDWAERKMSGKGSRAGRVPATSKKEIVRASPEFERYRAGIDEILMAMAEPGMTAPLLGAAPDAAAAALENGRAKPAKADTTSMD